MYTLHALLIECTHSMVIHFQYNIYNGRHCLLKYTGKQYTENTRLQHGYWCLIYIFQMRENYNWNRLLEWVGIHILVVKLLRLQIIIQTGCDWYSQNHICVLAHGLQNYYKLTYNLNISGCYLKKLDFNLMVVTDLLTFYH